MVKEPNKNRNIGMRDFHNAKAVKSAAKKFHGLTPEGNEHSSSIRALSGGLPSLGRHN